MQGSTTLQTFGSLLAYLTIDLRSVLQLLHLFFKARSNYDNLLCRLVLQNRYGFTQLSPLKVHHFMLRFSSDLEGESVTAGGVFKPQSVKCIAPTKWKMLYQLSFLVTQRTLALPAFVGLRSESLSWK